MFILDTDHLGIIQQLAGAEFGNLARRMREHRLEDFFVTIVSFHEQVAGWNAYIHGARDSERVVRGYAMFESILSGFAAMNLLSFDSEAARTFAELRKSRVRVGTMDLRIGAIGLVRRFTVLTRNTTDFTRIPGLRVEDWTLAF